MLPDANPNGDQHEEEVEPGKDGDHQEEVESGNDHHEEEVESGKETDNDVIDTVQVNKMICVTPIDFLPIIKRVPTMLQDLCSTGKKREPLGKSLLGEGGWLWFCKCGCKPTIDQVFE